jgi:hypothetical protein
MSLLATSENLGPIGSNGLSLVSSDISRRKPRTAALDFGKIDKEVTNGLKNEKARLTDSWRNRQWYEGNIKPFLAAISREQNLRMESARTTNVMESWIDLLTKHLYAGKPKRTIPDQPDITEYLETVYSKSNIDNIMTEANRYAIVGGVCAIQVEIKEPLTDAETESFLALQQPAVSHRIWPADQFVVWCHPDKPTMPWAVGTIDFYDQQRRLRIWTSERLVTYQTDKFNADQPWDGVTYKQVSDEENWLGFVPFSFVWWKRPTGEFWTPSLGDTMQMFQESLTTRLWKQNDDILNQRPILQARNVRSDFVIPRQYQAGDMLRMSPVLNQLGDGPEPSIEYAYCDLSYLQSDRDQLDWDMTMFADTLGIPESAWRMKGQSASSGVAIVSEQLPLLEAAERRQEALAQYEQDLAAVTLMASHVYLGGNTPISKVIETDFDLVMNWGRSIKNRPGPDNDAHIQFELLNGLQSKAGAIAEIQGITLEQAREKLEEINEDLIAEATAAAQVTQITTPPALAQAQDNAPMMDPEAEVSDPETEDPQEGETE